MRQDRLLERPTGAIVFSRRTEHANAGGEKDNGNVIADEEKEAADGGEGSGEQQYPVTSAAIGDVGQEGSGASGGDESQREGSTDGGDRKAKGSKIETEDDGKGAGGEVAQAGSDEEEAAIGREHRRWLWVG